MGLEYVCTGSLSHQNLLTLFIEPVHTHMAAYRPHSPVHTRVYVCVCVCVCVKERLRVGYIFWSASESTLPWFSSVCVFVCAQVCIHFPPCECEGNLLRFEQQTQTPTACFFRGISARWPSAVTHRTWWMPTVLPVLTSLCFATHKLLARLMHRSNIKAASGSFHFALNLAPPVDKSGYEHHRLLLQTSWSGLHVHSFRKRLRDATFFSMLFRVSLSKQYQHCLYKANVRQGACCRTQGFSIAVETPKTTMLCYWPTNLVRSWNHR